ncbi:MAG: hypothetical protein IJ971_04110 [Bacteroidales bacterium]|nr:hypothetical protein [Bacteroidales bacterium]
MSRKSLIICLAVLASMILGVSIAVAVLYSGTGGGQGRKGNAVPDQERYLLLPAVPADAVLVACLSDVEDAAGTLLSGLSFPSALADSISAGAFHDVASSSMAVSVHYNGDLQALYVFDAGKASPEPTEDFAALMQYARSMGMYSDYVDCSALTDGGRDIAKRSVVIVSESETLVKSSRRHLEKSISVMDAAGFADASSSVSGPDVIFFANSHARMLMSGIFTRRYASHHPFVSGMAQWIAIDLTKADGSGIHASAVPVFGNDPSEFMTVLSNMQPSVSKVADMLPSYTVSAVSLPMKNTEAYMDAYQAYMDSKQSLHSFKKKQRDLETRTGVKPEEFVRRLDVKEMARATFMTGGALDTVNLMRIGREDTLIFVGTENKSFKDYEPAIHSWPYASFASSVFGKFFDIKDESCFTYIDGWIISGSLEAVEEYVDGRTLEYTLVEYMADAGQKDMFSSSPSSLVAYFSLTEHKDGHARIFDKSFAEVLKSLYEDADYCPLVMNVTNGKNGIRVGMQIPRLTLLKTKAPEHERDTTVVVPQGPFLVKNSGTGRNNYFYQNQHGSLCLQEEGGKGLWGVPFKGKLCGTAQNVDYYANDKLQIIFGSGSSIYIIDRLGRFVNGFPVDLGKEILIGPDVYDFNGTKAYNIMVLHKDSTIEMYNLKGRKPASWKTIIAPETVKGLPERLIVGGNTFWVVRTSVQTLIYPFNGGSAVTVFKGDQMIRPDSEVRVTDGTSVSVDCYDGKARTVKLK